MNQHGVCCFLHGSRLLLCCKLVCCSKAMAQIVHRKCAGQLGISLVADRRSWQCPSLLLDAEVFQQWMVRNGCLIRALELEPDYFEAASGLDQVGPALKAAIAAARNMQLLKLGSIVHESTLEQLAPALSHTTQLTGLSIEYCERAGYLTRGLSVVTHRCTAALRSLVFVEQEARWVIWQLQNEDPRPGSSNMVLQGGMRTPRPARDAVNLQHLTALKELYLNDLIEIDVLPAALTALTVGVCHRLEPCLAVEGLQRLQLQRVVPTAQLQHILPRLVQLQDLSLACGDRTLKGMCRYHANTSVQKLELKYAAISKHPAAAIAQSKQLTGLKLLCSKVNKPQVLASALQELPALQELSLGWLECDTAGDMRALLAGMAGVSSLRTLAILQTSLEGAAPAEQLSAVKQLTALQLSCCQGVDAAAAAMLRAELPNCQCRIEFVSGA